MQTNNIRDEKIETLNELIAVTRDSAEFYGDAATKADNPQLQSLFREMAASKGQLLGALSSEVGAEGATPDRDGTFRGSLNKLYGDVRAKLGGGDYGYVAQLEASEDRMLEAFNDTLTDQDTPATVRTAVQSYLPQVKAQHDLMRDKKWAMESSRH